MVRIFSKIRSRFIKVLNDWLPVNILNKLRHKGFRKYFKNTGWIFFSRIFSLALSFFVSIYMARSLGVENFGQLNFIMSFVSIAGTSIFVIDSLLIKRLNNEPENTNKILGSALIIKIINSFFTIITATLIAYLFASDKTTITLVFVFSTFAIFQSLNIVDSYFQANADVKKLSILTTVISVISALVRVFIITLHVDIVYVLLSYVFDNFMFALGYIYLYRKYVGPIFKWKIDKNTIKIFIVNSWPFTIAALATSIYIRVDQIFLKVLLGSGAVGLYVVAVRFSEVWFFISSAICAALLPAILNAQKTNQEVFLLRSKRLYSLLFYIALMICIFIFIFAPLIIKTLYGQAYLASITLLRIYIWSIVGVFIGTALQQMLLAQNKFKTILSLSIVGMLSSLILNYLFIPMWGIKGAAIANIFAYTLPVIVILSFNKMKDQRSSLISGIFKPLS